MNNIEIYAPIPDFPNYLITSHGRVLNIKKGMRELKPTIKDGRKRVALSFNGCVKRFYVSKLVRTIFNKRRDKYETISISL